ncbi:MAG TPA: DUF2007 domain-containing protein [Flavipsychrobacter sp.]|nr:DUF2007 domain-containing protein [Flavipsychrobacter sp.]
MDNLVTIKSFTYAHEAAMARSVIESEDIFCFLKDELTIQANPFYSNALGGVKLQVKEEDRVNAIRILKEYGYLDSENNKTATITNATGEINECPVCNSGDISIVKKPSKILFAIPFFLLGFPIPFFSKWYHCFNCTADIKVVKQRKN